MGRQQVNSRPFELSILTLIYPPDVPFVATPKRSVLHIQHPPTPPALPSQYPLRLLPLLIAPIAPQMHPPTPTSGYVSSAET